MHVWQNDHLDVCHTVRSSLPLEHLTQPYLNTPHVMLSVVLLQHTISTKLAAA